MSNTMLLTSSLIQQTHTELAACSSIHHTHQVQKKVIKLYTLTVFSSMEMGLELCISRTFWTLSAVLKVTKPKPLERGSQFLDSGSFILINTVQDNIIP